MRQPKCTLIIGKNGTGKSTLAERLALAPKRRVLVMDYAGKAEIWKKYGFLDIAKAEDCAAFSGVRRIFYEAYGKHTFDLIYKNLRDCVIVFDDCKNYMKSNLELPAMQGFKRLLIDYRHRMVDVFVVAHSVNDIPPSVWGHASDAFVGHSARLISGDRKEMLADPDRFIAAQMSAKRRFEKAKPGQQYGIFEHIKL